MTLKQFALEDRFLEERGTIALSGVQAIVRIPLDQKRADAARGLNTAAVIAGYRGSPLGGIDLTLEANQGLFERHDVKFISGLNEDLGATIVFGGQLANMMRAPKYDGVMGMWYGKAPGVDRAGDAFRHAQYAGVDHNGGVLAIAGDDPADKSSTLPSQSEYALHDQLMPILYPGNVQEILDYGRYGYELSRYSGLWVSMKIVTNVADEYSTTLVAPDRVNVVDPGFTVEGRPWRHTQDDRMIAPYTLDMERELHEGRIEAAQAWLAANNLNRTTVDPSDAWLGIVAPGKTYFDVREALARLGLGDDELARRGVRLLKLAALYPTDPETFRRFARGLDEIFVIEEKRSFNEGFIRQALYGQADQPRIVGKRDEDGSFLVPAYGELDADVLLGLLPARLTQKIPADALATPARPTPTLSLTPAPASLEQGAEDLARTPYFCSGCPHNRSTAVPEGSVAGGGIGCHGMALLIPARNVEGITQMGAEGAQWVGASQFVEENHRFQNLGDGTFFHSGSLAIRQAVAAGTNITYKILYNGAVAMTGGQRAAGEMPVPELSRLLEAEGVVRTIVLTDDVDKYGKRARFAANAEVRDRDDLDEAQRELRDVPGVTAVIYDQPCAAELRRKRRRGQIEDPNTRVIINEEVCEGCGDCGAKSNCLSVQPSETEFGRKTQIHQASCNKDYSCLLGDCPAFLTVIPTREAVSKPVISLDPIGEDLAEPRRERPLEGNVYLMGIGGTGVVTVSQTIATAALIDGKWAATLDQTGLSQKGGPVVSNLKITVEPTTESNKVGVGQADAYIVFDLLAATVQKNLDRALPDRTVAIVSNSQIPTGSMVSDTHVSFPEVDALRRRIDARTMAAENVYYDAELVSRNVFDNHMLANMMVVGSAYQTGSLPVSAAAIEKAIELNGVAVATNIQAFRIGRKIVAELGFVDTLIAHKPTRIESPVVTGKAAKLVARVGATGELERLLKVRVPELIEYQSASYAADYVDFVAEVVAREREVGGDSRLSEAVARYLYKLMAYKDEYEVARLHLKAAFRDDLDTMFGADAKVSFKLHPPMMRALGLDSKIGIPRAAAEPTFKALARLKRLRGTKADVFGRTEERRIERALIGEYRALITDQLAGLSATTYDRAVTLAELPDMVRGYDKIKLENVKAYRAEIGHLTSETSRPNF